MNTEIENIIKNIKFNKPLLTEEELKKQEQERLSHEELRKAQQRYNEAEVPTLFRENSQNLVLDGDWGRKLEELKGKLGEGALLLLIGTPGTGKTQMAVELLRYAVTCKGKTGMFAVSTDIKMTLKSTFGGSGEAEYTRKLTKRGVLVIDEIDWFFGNKDAATEDYWTGVFYHIINSRYNYRLDTILTSNRTKDALTALLPEPVWGRISETGGVVRMENWTNWRVR